MRGYKEAWVIYSVEKNFLALILGDNLGIPYLHHDPFPSSPSSC